MENSTASQRPPLTAAAAKAAARAAGVDTGSDENSFGDLLSELLRTLPSEASALFLRSLSGLSPSESHDFCDHVSKLKPEKQFRVIQAMSEATVDGKRRFLQALAKKIAEQDAKQKEIHVKEEKDMEVFMKRKEAMHAKERVAAMNPAATKFHSFNAALGAGVAVKQDVPATTTASASVASPKKPTSEEVGVGVGEGVSRSLSSSSLQAAVGKEDIKQVGRLLSNSHITESEHNLRELEINKKAFAALKASTSSDGSSSVEMADAAKRDRPDSIRELVKHDEKPFQRTRSDDTEYSSNTGSLDNGDEDDDGDESPDGDADSQNPDDPDAPSTKRWTKMQDNALRESVRIHGEKNWKAIAELVPGRNHAQCLQRWRKVLKPGLVKGHWSFEEDQILEYLVTQGCNNWGQIAERIPGRTPKQCRERWKNHLDPAINKGPYTEEEDQVILDAQARLGNRWSQIAQLLKGRTEDSVKIRWKSLKQNPAKAAATHAQIKKAQQQQQQQQHLQTQQSMLHQSQSQAAALAYQQNPALLRQRQLQLMQQQQQLQQSDTAQLEHHQHLQQQQQLQLRLQERLLHQQQLQRHAMMMTANNQSTNDPLSLMKPDPSLTAPSPVSGLGLSMANSHLYSPAGYSTATTASFTQQLTGVDGGYDFNIQTNASGFGGFQAEHHHHSDDTTTNDPWDLHGSLGGDEFTRLGENPPPASFWENNYPKHGGGLLPEPIPLSNQIGHLDPANPHGQFDDGVYDEAMFEKLASELGSNGLHFATAL